MRLFNLFKGTKAEQEFSESILAKQELLDLIVKTVKEYFDSLGLNAFIQEYTEKVIRKSYSDKTREILINEISSEKFIDAVIERINRKQLYGNPNQKR